MKSSAGVVHSLVQKIGRIHKTAVQQKGLCVTVFVAGDRLVHFLMRGELLQSNLGHASHQRTIDHT
jgi:hypothetical protein